MNNLQNCSKSTQSAHIYNFLDSKLLPKVTTSTQCTEYHDIDNLISDNFLVRSRGFVADTTTKPPVEITFQLICPINIHYIILSRNLNHQYFTTLEILTKSENGNNFISTAYQRFNNTGIVFCNNRLYNPQNLPSNIDQNYHLAFFKPNALRAISTAVTIKVNIVKVERSVPGLGRVEIWGQVSRMCSAETVNAINRLMCTFTTSAAPTNAESSCSTVDDFEIPEDFKDAITFEVMALPVTLPSGNTVDQSTLDKCVENEASYGRSASDPFTGQQFTDTRKPIFNSALKHRIDMFLLQYAHRKETFDLKRTVGSVSEARNKRKIEHNFNSDKVFVCSESELRLDADDRLSLAIKRTIGSKGFVRFTSEEKVVEPDKSLCVKCNNGENLYAIRCEHFYCKNCLLLVYKDLKCELCNKTFCKNDPRKLNV